MKTVFIINPKAGKNKNIESFVEKLENEASKAERDIEIYITKAVGDATEFVKDYCELSRENFANARLFFSSIL